MEDYYKTKESVEEYIKLAEGVNGEQLISILKKVLPHGSKLLEIGSGPGTDWKILNNVYNTTGSDNSTEFLHHLNTQYPEGVFHLLDAVTLKTNKNFDGIYSNKVLHHLTDNKLIKSIRRQFEILNPNGIICHSFWNGKGAETFKGLYVNYHDEEYLRNIFKTKFEILLIDPYKEFDENDSILLIGKRK